MTAKKKKKELEVTFFDGNIYLYKETRSFVSSNQTFDKF